MNPHVDVDVLPVIYRQNFVNQSSPIPATMIVTPTADSHYRVSFILTGDLETCDVECLINWTDETGGKSYGFALNKPDEPGATVLIKVSAGRTLSFQTVVTYGTYSLFVVVESLD